MANAFTKVQFMEPPNSGGTGPVPVGAVKAGSGIQITSDGTINVTQGGGTINSIVCTNGIQGGGTTPQVFIGLLPPTDTTIGGVRTIEGSGISIDNQGVIRSTTTYSLQAGVGIDLSGVTPSGATVNVAIAGGVASARGGVYVSSTTNPGLTLSADGGLSLTPPQNGGIGGVKAGTGCSIDPTTGVLTATGTGGTITSVSAGSGLGGGGISGAVNLFLRPSGYNGVLTNIGGVYAGPGVTVDSNTGELTVNTPTATVPGVVKAGSNVTIAADGTLNVASNLGVLSVTGNTPINVDNTDPSNPVINVSNATTADPGVTRLSSALDSVSQTDAATPFAVKQVNDVAVAALPLAGGTMTGDITFNSGQTFPGVLPTSIYSFKGGIVVGSGAASPNNFVQLIPGAAGQVLTADATAQYGLKWTTVGTGTVTNVTGQAPIVVSNGSSTPDISVAAATTTTTGVVQLYDGVDSANPALAATASSVNTTYNYAATMLPLAGGSMTGDITFAGTQTFPGVLPLLGGTMQGDITFSGTQTFPGTLVEGSIGATGAIDIGGTAASPIISVDTATTAQLGVVQPDGTTITVDGNGVISAAASAGGTLQSVTDAGDTTTNPITANTITTTGVFQISSGGAAVGVLTGDAAGTSYLPSSFTVAGTTRLSSDAYLESNGVLRFYESDNSNFIGLTSPATLAADVTFTLPATDGTAGEVLTTDGAGNLSFAPNLAGTAIQESEFSAAGSLLTSTAANTPSELTIGANNAILAVNSGLPAWRTSAQLGLLTAATAATTYAPLDSPTFSGPVTINGGGSAGANALTLSGGNLVLATSFTPASSSSPGSVGELAWDNSGYLYFCYLPNTWGRVQIDLTPF